MHPVVWLEHNDGASRWMDGEELTIPHFNSSPVGHSNNERLKGLRIMHRLNVFTGHGCLIVKELGQKAKDFCRLSPFSREPAASAEKALSVAVSAPRSPEAHG